MAIPRHSLRTSEDCHLMTLKHPWSPLSAGAPALATTEFAELVGRRGTGWQAGGVLSDDQSTGHDATCSTTRIHCEF